MPAITEANVLFPYIPEAGRRKPNRLLLCFTFFLLAVIYQAPLSAQITYTVTELLPSLSSAQPLDLNASGQAAIFNFGHDSTQSFFYGQGAATQIIAPNNDIVFSARLNDLGQVVGKFGPNRLITTAFVYDSSTNTFTNLGTLGGATSYATDINNLGQIVGQTQLANGALRPFLYDSTGMHNIGTLDGGISAEALGINDAGEIVGDSYTSGGSEQAFVYSDGIMKGLGSFGIWSAATDINNSGMIVGTSAYSAHGPTRAFFSDGTNLIDLGTLGGFSSSANGINDQGDIVGQAQVSTSGFAAFIYHNGIMTNLNSLVGLDPHGVGYGLGNAFAINDAGQIVCDSGDGPVLLTPIIPSPATIPLTSGLFVALAFTRRRSFG